MKDDVLFEVTKDHVETGMRGIPVGYCTTSYVDPQKGLFYVGRPVSEICKWEPIQVIYLLVHGQQGNVDQVKQFEGELSSRGKCSEEVIEHIQSLPKKGHPMDLFSSAIMILGKFEKRGVDTEDALNLIAKLPHLVAILINYHAGWGETPFPQPGLGYMENFAHMLNVPDVDDDLLIQALKLFNILHYDHGGGNLSAFVGKAVASGLEHLYGAISASMNALAGPRHGKANQDSLEFVQKILDEVGAEASARQVEKLVRERLERKDLVSGFGHAVLLIEDPRATVMYEFVQKYFPNHPMVKIAQLLRSEGSKVLSENPRIADPHPNVDAISGTMLTAVGFKYPEYFTILFGLSRSVGIAVQIIYERTEARNGRGTPIIRPKYLYKGR